MGPILAKLGFPQAVGAYCDGRSVHVSRVVSTPFGSIEFDRYSETIEEADETAGIARSLNDLCSRRRRLRLTWGLPAERCYLATRPVTSTSGTASPNALAARRNVTWQLSPASRLRRQNPFSSFTGCGRLGYSW